MDIGKEVRIIEVEEPAVQPLEVEEVPTVEPSSDPVPA
jgi:hypothetical protein